MRLKKTTLALLLMLGTMTPPVQGSGVPTVDAAALLQQAQYAQQQAQAVLAQLNKAKEAIAQARSQYEHHRSLIQGNAGMADFLNDPSLNNLIPSGDWSQLYGQTRNLPDLRQRYGLMSGDPAVQASFDKLLVKADVLEKEKVISDRRVQHAGEMRKKLNWAQTPQQKQDLALRYQQELLELQTQQIRLENTRRLMDEKEKLEDRKRAQDFKDYMLGRRASLPVYD